MSSVDRWIRGSTVPYLSFVAIAVGVAPHMTYLIRTDVTVKGQPPAIAFELIVFLAAATLWLLHQGRPIAGGGARAVLVAALVAWATRTALLIGHGDQFSHLIWLTPVFLAMLWFKAPTWRQAWAAVVVLAWALAFVLVSAYLLEVTHVLQPLYLPEEITEFQQQQYWLPLDGFLGVEGRWTGPFGHNTRAGLAAAYIFTIGAVRWTRSSIPLLAIGGYMLLITSVRASYLAAATGIAVAILFSRQGRLKGVPVWPRWALLAGVATFGGLAMSLTGAGLTGRQVIWPTFAALVPTSPFIGIGGGGIREAGGLVAQSGDAHNVLLDELVRFGIVGFGVMAVMLIILLFVAFRSANRGFCSGAAVLAVYLIASLTDVQNDWLQLGYHSVLVVLAGITAAVWWDEQQASKQ